MWFFSHVGDGAPPAPHPRPCVPEVLPCPRGSTPQEHTPGRLFVDTVGGGSPSEGPAGGALGDVHASPTASTNVRGGARLQAPGNEGEGSHGLICPRNTLARVAGQCPLPYSTLRRPPGRSASVGEVRQHEQRISKRECDRNGAPFKDEVARFFPDRQIGTPVAPCRWPRRSGGYSGCRDRGSGMNRRPREAGSGCALPSSRHGSAS